jgi:hypothetical protein
LKGRKSEYEELARQINEYEAQDVVMERIAGVEGDSRRLEAESNSEQIVLKHKQLHALVSMIHDLMGEEHFNRVIRAQNKAAHPDEVGTGSGLHHRLGDEGNQ